MFQFAVTRKYIAESPPAGVRHFDERRERPAKRMLSVEEEQRIFEAAPPYLGVAIILLVQTGGRTYSGGFSLRWDQVDLENLVIHLAGELKTSDSAQPVPLTRQACEPSSRMEKRTGTEKPISLSQSARFQQANWQCKEGLADYTQEGRSTTICAMWSARD
jgi:integrase